MRRSFQQKEIQSVSLLQNLSKSFRIVIFSCAVDRLCAAERTVLKQCDVFFKALAEGASKDVDIMIGTTSEEMKYWTYLFYLTGENGIKNYYDIFMTGKVATTLIVLLSSYQEPSNLARVI